MAFWSRIINSDGKPGSIPLQVPDYFNGTIRVFAVAATDNAVGIVERKVIAQGYFVIQPQAPYFATPGDEFEITALVANNLPPAPGAVAVISAADQILEAYLNVAPYGGNVEGGRRRKHRLFRQAVPGPFAAGGADACSDSAESRDAESARRNGSDRAGARVCAWRPSMGTQLCVAAGERPRGRIEMTATKRDELPFLAPHLVDRELTAGPPRGRIVTTIDADVQKLIEQQLKGYVERNRNLGLTNGSVILIDYRTMQVIAYVGSASYFNEAIDGEVNGLRGRRSPGSALKQFIYALAIDQGLIHPQTMLKDTPLRLAEYDPENFDHDFNGAD